MEVHFYKYHGAGNDFVILDNRDGKYDSIKSSNTLIGLCHRRFGIGADGLMMIEKEAGYDFKMVYFNADGNIGSMCGNGGRCIVALAFKLGIIKKQALFLAADGIHEAVVITPDYIELKMNDLTHMEIFQDHVVLDTGSPHYVLPVSNLADFPVLDKGKAIRYSSEFPKGININFVEKKDGQWHIRTYERGVEDETWACGTGATAAALAMVEIEKMYSSGELKLLAKGGPLTIRFNRKGPGYFENVWLCGGAAFVFEGKIKI